MLRRRKAPGQGHLAPIPDRVIAVLLTPPDYVGTTQKLTTYLATFSHPQFGGDLWRMYADSWIKPCID